MKNSKKLIILAIILQSLSCVAMDDNTQERIRNFVQKQLSKQQEEPITFFFELGDDIRRFFPTERLSLPAQSHQAIRNKSIELSPSFNKPSQQSPAQKNLIIQEQSNFEVLQQEVMIPLTCCSDKKNKCYHPQQPIIARMPVIKPTYQENKLSYIENQGTRELQFNIDKLLAEKSKVYNNILNGKINSKRTGPYLHKESGLLFGPFQSGQTYIYNGKTDNIIIVNNTFRIPNTVDIEDAQEIFLRIQ